MDYSTSMPERYWVNPDLHTDLVTCSTCGGPLNFDVMTPMLRRTQNRAGALCASCASFEVSDKHPLTPDYLDWINSGDMRWWSVHICQHCLEAGHEPTDQP